MKLCMKKMMAFLVAGALVALCGLAGCSQPAQKSNDAAANASAANTASEQAAQGSAQSQITIPLTVMNVVVGGPEMSIQKDVVVAEGATVLDALKAAELELDIQNSQYGAFVAAINGLAGEGMKGWTYTVNGEKIPTSADATPLKQGDVVKWVYVDMSS